MLASAAPAKTLATFSVAPYDSVPVVLRAPEFAGDVRIVDSSGASAGRFLSAAPLGIAVAVVQGDGTHSVWQVITTGETSVLDAEHVALAINPAERADLLELYSALRHYFDDGPGGLRMAIAQLTQLLSATVDDDARRAIGGTLIELLLVAGDPQRARAALDVLHTASDELWSSSARAQILAAEGDFAGAVEQLRGVIRAVCQAHAMTGDGAKSVQCANLSLRQAQARLMLAYRAQDMGSVATTKTALEEALRVGQRFGATSVKSEAYAALSVWALLAGNLAAGESYLRLEVQTRNGDGSHPDKQLAARTNLMGMLRRRGQLHEAQRMGSELLSEYEAWITPAARAAVFHNQALAYESTGALAPARRYFARAKALFLEGGDEFSAQISAFREASAARLLGDAQAALTAHEAAKAYFRGKSKEHEARLRIELARDHLALGDLDSALLELAAGEQGDVFGMLPSYKLDALVTLFDIAKRRDDAIAMAGVAQEYDADFQGTQATPESKLELLSRLIPYRLAIGDFGGANAYIDEALDYVRLVRAQFSAGEVSRRWSHRTHQVVSASVQVLLDPACAPRADCTLRAFQLLDEFENYWVRAGRRIKYGLGATDPGSPTTAMQRYLAAESRLVGAPPSAESTKAVLREVDALREALVSQSDVVSPVELPNIDLEATQRLLGTSTLLLRYHLARDGLLTRFVLSDGELRVDQRRVAGLRKRLRQLIQSRGRDAGAGTAIYSAMFADVLGEHPGSRKLVLILPAELAAAPLSALPLPDGSGSLIDSYTLVQAISVADYALEADNQLSDEGSLPVADIAVFADPAFSNALQASASSDGFRSWSTTLQRLPFTAQEAASIQQIFEGYDVLTFTGPEANAANMLSKGVRGARIAHFATHGYFSESTPGVVGLAVAPATGDPGGGFVSLTRLLQHSFRSELVIFSGCQTALGESLDGAGLTGLTHGVLARGADAVIGTLWPIPDRPTAIFMREFYINLRSTRGDAAAALRRAQRSLKRNRSFRRPEHWAGFVLVAADAGHAHIM